MKKNIVKVVCIFYSIFVILSVLFFFNSNIFLQCKKLLYPKLLCSIFLPIVIYTLLILIMVLCFFILIKIKRKSILKILCSCLLIILLNFVFLTTFFLGYDYYVHSYTNDIDNYLITDSLPNMHDYSNSLVQVFPDKTHINCYENLYYYDYYNNFSDTPSFFIAAVIFYEDDYLMQKEKIISEYEHIEISYDEELTNIVFFDEYSFVIICDDNKETITYKSHRKGDELFNFENEFEEYLNDNNY